MVTQCTWALDRSICHIEESVEWVQWGMRRVPVVSWINQVVLDEKKIAWEAVCSVTNLFHIDICRFVLHLQLKRHIVGSPMVWQVPKPSPNWWKSRQREHMQYRDIKKELYYAHYIMTLASECLTAVINPTPTSLHSSLIVNIHLLFLHLPSGHACNGKTPSSCGSWHTLWLHWLLLLAVGAA